MKKQLPVIFALTLFVCGVFVGLIARSDSQAQQSDGSSKVTDLPARTGALAAEISGDLVCLQRLRAGETNEAIVVLELRVDGAVGMLGEGLRLIPSSERDPLQLGAIRIHRHYRRQFPLTNSPAYLRSNIGTNRFGPMIPRGIQEGIARAYALVPEDNGER
jgi:hypothetical protein